jgi:sugar phosphate isomerase/epimerase
MTNLSGNLSRRQALAALGLLAVSSRTAWGAAEAGKRPGMALQLYTMRDPAKKDLADTLKKVRAMGWEYVQWSGMPSLPAEKIREALDTAGLKAIAAHVSVETFEKDFDGQVRFWKTVGVKDVAPGGMMNDCKATLADWLKGAKRLDTLGAKLRAEGMRLTYHNHSWEFEKFADDPRAKLEILLESTSPENLGSELDIAWALAGGYDPAAFLRKYKGRFPVVHAKDVIPGEGKRKAKLTPLGKGSVNWKEVFAAGPEAGIEWYIYEQDSGEGSPFEYAAESYQYLKQNLP